MITTVRHSTLSLSMRRGWPALQKSSFSQPLPAIGSSLWVTPCNCRPSHRPIALGSTRTSFSASPKPQLFQGFMSGSVSRAISRFFCGSSLISLSAYLAFSITSATRGDSLHARKVKGIFLLLIPRRSIQQTKGNGHPPLILNTLQSWLRRSND